MASGGETKRDRRILIATWAVLMALTLGSLRIAEAVAVRESESTLWLLAFATLKGHLIAAIFMEMRCAPRVWAVVMSGFLIAEAALVFAILG
jgi:hypothetical protein